MDLLKNVDAALFGEITRWVFTEGHSALNANSHCDIAWAAALSADARCENRWEPGARVGWRDLTHVASSFVYTPKLFDYIRF